jgi:hypothetical protein
MMPTLAVHAPPSRILSRVSTALVAAGAVALAVGIASGRAPEALAALDFSWLFFAGLSAGSIALALVVRMVEGRWADPVLPIADAPAGFFTPAFVVLLVMVVGARTLAPLAWPGLTAVEALALRQLLPTAVLFALGRRVMRLTREAPRDSRAALVGSVAYLLSYVIALSLWAFDWIMSLSRSPPATVVPAYYFVGAFLSGLAWVVLSSTVRHGSNPSTRHDMGKLLFGFIVVWMYLLWSLFLATWYGNVPAEAEPLLRRWGGVYRPLTVAVILAVFVGPFALLLSEKLKRRRLTLGLAAVCVLLGLWAERLLLVLPSLELAGGPASLAIGSCVAMGMAGLFLRSVLPEMS